METLPGLLFRYSVNTDLFSWFLSNGLHFVGNREWKLTFPTPLANFVFLIKVPDPRQKVTDHRCG